MCDWCCGIFYLFCTKLLVKLKFIVVDGIKNKIRDCQISKYWAWNNSWNVSHVCNNIYIYIQNVKQPTYFVNGAEMCGWLKRNAVNMCCRRYNAMSYTISCVRFATLPLTEVSFFIYSISFFWFCGCTMHSTDGLYELRAQWT